MTIEVLTQEQILERCRTAPMSVVGLTSHHQSLLDKAAELEPGYYVVQSDPLPEILEGPHAGEDYAKHRAHTLHGLARIEAQEITEDELPW